MLLDQLGTLEVTCFMPPYIATNQVTTVTIAAPISTEL